LKNFGRSPVAVQEVSVNAYRRGIEEPWKSRLKDQWKNRRQAPFKQNERRKRASSLPLDMMMIGPNLGKWTTFDINQTVNVPASENEGQIRKSQSRMFLLHFLVADGS